MWDVISTLPNGLDTVVAERGTRLSGGEKQRICLARLLLKAPSVIILDEATAYLDSESEAAVQRALESVLVGRTAIVIAHRLSTVREAYQILVVSDGHIAERGTHDELLAWDGIYAKLYQTQFAREPAVNGTPRPGALPLGDRGVRTELAHAGLAAAQTQVLNMHAAGQFLEDQWVSLPVQPVWRLPVPRGRHRRAAAASALVPQQDDVDSAANGRISQPELD